jgi:hypothetical protein
LIKQKGEKLISKNIYKKLALTPTKHPTQAFFIIGNNKKPLNKLFFQIFLLFSLPHYTDINDYSPFYIIMALAC